jgi:hypothetical protein
MDEEEEKGEGEEEKEEEEEMLDETTRSGCMGRSVSSAICISCCVTL